MTSAPGHTNCSCGEQNDLKKALGLYRDLRRGEDGNVDANRASQKAWAKLRTRMESAGLIETVIALVDGRQTTCIRCGLHAVAGATNTVPCTAALTVLPYLT